MTLSEVINYIDKALNYPAVSVEDIDLYFNQAFSEINTQLHLSLPSLEDMRREAMEKLASKHNIVNGTTEPLPDNRFTTALSTDTVPDNAYYYLTDTQKFKFKGNSYEKLYYIFFDTLRKKYRLYEATIVDDGAGATWFEIYENPSDVDMEDYLPKDWLFLFIIPYVCFKQAVKDGDQGILFNQEMSIGFNQLRDSYHIPEKVLLKDVIHLPAYRGYAKSLEDGVVNWYQWIPTRAIYDIYKIPRAVGSVYQDFYNKGGWGI